MALPVGGAFHGTPGTGRNPSRPRHLRLRPTFSGSVPRLGAGDMRPHPCPWFRRDSSLDCPKCRSDPSLRLSVSRTLGTGWYGMPG